MAFTINVVIGLDPALMKLATEFAKTIEADVAAILANTEKIMATLDDVLADVTAETTAIGSITTLIQGLQAQIAAAGLSPADQAKVDAIFADAEANKAALATALAANVPPVTASGRG